MLHLSENQSPRERLSREKGNDDFVHIVISPMMIVMRMMMC